MKHLAECFACYSPADRQYTLILDADKILEEKPLCEVCLRDFRAKSWIEVQKIGQTEKTAAPHDW